MPHMHKNIRDAIETAVTGLTTTGSNIFPQSVYPIAQGILPSLAIFALEEEIDLDAMGNTPIQMRTLEVAIEGLAQGAAKGPSDTLAQIAAEVEAAMAADLTLGGLVTTLGLTEINYFYGDEETAKPTGAIRLTYAVEYRTTTLDPTTSV